MDRLTTVELTAIVGSSKSLEIAFPGDVNLRDISRLSSLLAP
jgi:hypothetical protein